ncbi:porin [Dysgonomonas sp. 511]|uniref:porin n=1 Tax=Dysgonomonas sp. 511 TaxID=2302930 RepID=UPI0013D8031C|nr:porin [Dysgonomonas sp. 511]
MKNITKLLYLSLLLLPAGLFAQDGVTFEKYTLGEGVTMKSNSDSYSLNLRGFVQTQSDTRFYEGGDDNSLSRFRIRRARLRLSGDAFRKKVSYVLSADFSESLAGEEEANSILKDAYIRYNPTSNWSVTFGQRSLGTDSREMLIGSNSLAFVDRSKVSSAFSTIREVGLFVEGTVRVGNNSFLRPSLIITDGDGSFTTGKRTGGLKYGGRINYLPFGRFREFGEFRGADLVRELTPKLSVGAAFSYNNATSDRRGGRTTGSIMYLDIDEQPALPSYSKLVADFLFKYKGLSVLGEFAKTWAGVPDDIHYRVRNDGTYATTFEGGVEDYVKGRMMLGSGYNIEASYLFPALYLVGARYTHLRPDKNSYMHNTLYNNRRNFYEISAAKYLTRSHAIKVQASFIYVDARDGSRNLLNRDMENKNEMMFQTLLQVSF